MRPTNLIFVEGIIGAGKTTTGEFLTGALRRQGLAATFLPEGPTIDSPIHPLRVAPELPHPQAAWLDLTVDDFVETSLQKWRRFVDDAVAADQVTVCDGLLFHGNLTDLLLMDAAPSALHRYVAQIVDVTRPLQPSVLYLYHANVEAALRAICNERGSAWEAYQVSWKVSSPYATRRGLQGFPGLVHLYRDYRALCDGIVVQLPLPVLAICNDGEWTTKYREICGFLGLHDDEV